MGNPSFQVSGDEVGEGRKRAGEQRQTPIVRKQHGGIRHQYHAGVKDLGGEFPHSLHACVHVCHSLCHDRTEIFLFQILPTHVDKTIVKHMSHIPARVVGEPAHAEAFDCPHGLHEQDHGEIQRRQGYHGGHSLIALHNIKKALRELSLEIRPRHHPYVIENTGGRNEHERPCLQPEVGTDAVRLRDLFNPMMAHFCPSPSKKRWVRLGKPALLSVLERA